METKIQYGTREIQVLKTYDTVIVGGGSAGSSAGYTSAKGGFSTLIIDKAICGSTWQLAYRCPFCK